MKKAKEKLLVIVPRISNTIEDGQAKRLSNIIKALVRSFDVHLLYIQSMFEKEESKKAFIEIGVKIFSMGELKKKKGTSWEKQLSILFEYKRSILSGILW